MAAEVSGFGHFVPLSVGNRTPVHPLLLLWIASSGPARHSRTTAPKGGFALFGFFDNFKGYFKFSFLAS